MQLVEEAFNQKNFDVMDEVLAEDYVGYAPDGVFEGRDAMKDLWSANVAAMPDCMFDIETVIAEDDWVAIRSRFVATFTGPMPLSETESLEPTGEQIVVEHSVFYRLNEDGLIVEGWEYFDLWSYMAQLGALPPMEEMME